MSIRARGILIGVLVAGAAAALAVAAGLPAPAVWTAGITGLCAAWWITEPIPIPATSIIPFALFPLTGVLDHAEVAHAYGHTLILLLMGGFMLSAAVEKSGLHRRLALGMVRITGGGGRRLVLGFMLASGLCSMWISNTATVLMLLPVALAVLEAKGTDDTRLGPPLLLGIAYAASIGGMATPIGTPPNLIFMGIYEQQTGREVSFVAWMKIGLPVTLALLPMAWLMLTRSLGRTAAPRIAATGAWTPAERRVLVIFGATALAWIFRTEPFGGWSALLGVDTASDATVALAAVVVLFLVPSGPRGDAPDGQASSEPGGEARGGPRSYDGQAPSEPGGEARGGPRSDGYGNDTVQPRLEPGPVEQGAARNDGAGEDTGGALLDWKTAAAIPWGLLLLFGGGLAISAAFKDSGLSDELGRALAHAAGWHIVLVTALICLGVTFLTEVTSNTATTNLLMPILAAAALAANVEPMALMVPATFSASCAFMLPVATAPNAIVAGTPQITTRVMVREGFWLNLYCAASITALCVLIL